MASLYASFLKRSIDFVLATVLLLLCSPLLILGIVLLFVANHGKPFFMQRRPGLHGKVFWIVKLRTMGEARDATGALLPDEKRLTAVGKLVRKTSVDELPQLWNVLKGQMSLVGPRPLLEEYLPLYNDFQRRRHEVRPGITGWAQVKGRNALSWDEKFAYDVWYVDHLSLLLDIKIMWMTIAGVLRPEGISSPTSATMEKFSGST